MGGSILIFVLCVGLPIVIGLKITKNVDSFFIRGAVIVTLIIITFIVGNAFYQHVGLIQSAKSLDDTFLAILFVIILCVLLFFNSI